MIGRRVFGNETGKLKAMGIEEATVYTLIQIITPFAVFLIADELGLSGILAVVVFGLEEAALFEEDVS